MSYRILLLIIFIALVGFSLKGFCGNGPRYWNRNREHCGPYFRQAMLAIEQSSVVVVKSLISMHRLKSLNEARLGIPMFVVEIHPNFSLVNTLSSIVLKRTKGEHSLGEGREIPEFLEIRRRMVFDLAIVINDSNAAHSTDAQEWFELLHKLHPQTRIVVASSLPRDEITNLISGTKPIHFMGGE